MIQDGYDSIPQIAPILWLNLFVMFLVAFVLFIIINYYIAVPKEVEIESKELRVREKA